MASGCLGTFCFLPGFRVYLELIEGQFRVHIRFMVRGSHLPFHQMKFLIFVNLGKMRNGNLDNCKFLQMLEFRPEVLGGNGFGHLKNWRPQYRLTFMIGTPEGNPPFKLEGWTTSSHAAWPCHSGGTIAR